MKKPLDGLRAVSLAINAPGPIATMRLRNEGMHITKVEPPAGDPVSAISPEWYGRMVESMEVVRLDLKQPGDRGQLDVLLEQADLLITAQRPVALERLGIAWEPLHVQFPRLCYVAIVGYPPPRENVPGHDLNYQAAYGMLTPPHVPRVLVADMAGAEQTAGAAMALLLARERGLGAGFRFVALSSAAKDFSDTIAAGVSSPGGVLGGALPNYNLYATKSGYLAVGALEPHFYARLCEKLGCVRGDFEEFGAIFAGRSAEEWEAWAAENDLPLAAVK